MIVHASIIPIIITIISCLNKQSLESEKKILITRENQERIKGTTVNHTTSMSNLLHTTHQEDWQAVDRTHWRHKDIESQVVESVQKCPNHFPSLPLLNERKEDWGNVENWISTTKHSSRFIPSPSYSSSFPLPLNWSHSRMYRNVEKGGKDLLKIFSIQKMFHQNFLFITLIVILISLIKLWLIPIHWLIGWFNSTRISSFSLLKLLVTFILDVNERFKEKCYFLKPYLRNKRKNFSPLVSLPQLSSWSFSLLARSSVFKIRFLSLPETLWLTWSWKYFLNVCLNQNNIDYTWIIKLWSFDSMAARFDTTSHFFKSPLSHEAHLLKVFSSFLPLSLPSNTFTM